MNDLILIFEEYIDAVENVCSILLNEINRSENLNLKTKFDFFEYRAKNRKMKFEFCGITFQLHGIGCAAFNEEFHIDWDFGYQDRWCGIDTWKVAMYLKRNNSKHTKFYDGRVIQQCCDEFVKQGIMFKKDNRYYFK